MSNDSTPTKKDIEAEILLAREDIFDRMRTKGISHEDWTALHTQYQAYTTMLEQNKPGWKVSPDTALVVAANLVGIVLILTFERTDIVTSKALGFILKGRA